MSAAIPRRASRLAVAVLAATALMSVAAGTASAEEVVYNNVPSPLPGNFASIGLAATSSEAFGGVVELTNSARKHPTITVVMSSWTCETGAWNTENCVTKHPTKKFKVPVTIRVYGQGELNQAPYGEKTQNIGMFYRPSEDKVHCTGGRWYDAVTTECSHGYAFPISVKLTKLKKMPAKAIITVSYPHASGPVTSLNVSVSEPAEHTLSVGTDPTEELVIDSTWSEMYCSGATDVGKLGLSEGNCWEGDQPVFKVSASA